MRASNGHGHGTHSPFVFDFITQVLNRKTLPAQASEIENRRKALVANKNYIEVADFGAGSSVIKTNRRMIGKIAASSLKPAKYARLLFRMARHYQPKSILELGTSFGTTSSYLALSHSNARLYTCEGSAEIAQIARETFEQLNITNIEMITGEFSATLESLLKRIGKVDLAFVDGHHRRKPTLQYFETLLNYSHEHTILIFDDIHWSREMEEAWEFIKQHEAVTLSIDLFFIGCIFLNRSFKQKQHFTIRY